VDAVLTGAYSAAAQRSSTTPRMPKFSLDGRDSPALPANTKGPMTDEIRRILRENGRLTADVDSLADDADLYQAGMTSHASVNVMLALEDAFDVEFPDSMLKRSVFESVAAIAAAVSELQVGVPS
jgi:acyl carrier protein